MLYCNEIPWQGLLKATPTAHNLIFLSSQEDERGRSDSSESRKESPVIASVAEANKAPESGQTSAADPVGLNEGSCSNNNIKQEITEKMTKEENERKKVCGEFYISIFLTSLKLLVK